MPVPQSGSSTGSHETSCSAVVRSSLGDGVRGHVTRPIVGHRTFYRLLRHVGLGLVIALASAATSSCGGRPPLPKRGVVEADVGDWKFRRFQPVLDVEVWVPGNRAEAFTATYVRDAAERRGRIEERDVVSVFVTRYAKPQGVLRETVKLARRLAQEAGYAVDEGKVGGVRAVTITGQGEAWVMWAAGPHVVKVGGRGREDVPASVVSYYGERYPSVMPGSVLEGPLPPGGPASEEAEKPPKEEAIPYDPKNPRPDWERYDPKKPQPKPLPVEKK